MKRHRSLLLSTSALTFVTALGIFTPIGARATCTTVSSDTTVTDASISCITWNSSNITVSSGGVLTGTPTEITNSGNSVGTLTNSGSISGSAFGVLNASSSTIASIVNNNTIIGTTSGILNSGSIASILNSSIGTISGGTRGINNAAGATITSITNNGTITGPANDGIVNNGNVGSFINTGYLSGQSLGFCACNGSSTGTVTNTGTINGNRRAFVAVTGANVGTVDNEGVLTGATGIYNHNATTSLFINNGTIISSRSMAFFIDANGGIGTLNNNGTILAATTGILNNFGSNYLGTLNNGVSSNSGVIHGGSYGINVNTGDYELLINNATGSTISGQIGIAASYGGSIGTIINAGVIGGGVTGIANLYSTIGTLNNYRLTPVGSCSLR